MKSLVLKLVVLIVILALVAAVFYTVTHNPTLEKPIPEGVVCTMEAKLCPDGSYVGRSGPKCEFAACPGSTSTTTPATNATGIRGVVMLGPMCPVQSSAGPDSCNSKPYKTMVVAFKKSDPVHAVAFSSSNADGVFEFSLPPGDYTLGAGESNLPRCDHPEVTVGSSGYVAATISCDTGIR